MLLTLSLNCKSHLAMRWNRSCTHVCCWISVSNMEWLAWLGSNTIGAVVAISTAALRVAGSIPVRSKYLYYLQVVVPGLAVFVRDFYMFVNKRNYSKSMKRSVSACNKLCHNSHQLKAWHYYMLAYRNYESCFDCVVEITAYNQTTWHERLDNRLIWKLKLTTGSIFIDSINPELCFLYSN